MLNLLPLLLSASTAAPIGAVAGDDSHWIADFDEAVKIAKDEGKDLLVDFTGSDWCGWCIKLHDEVFKHDAFLDNAEEHFILVSLDYPNTPAVKAKVPNPKRNEELKKKYAIRGYPTVLLMTVDGDVFAQTGYREGGPEKYVEHLAEQLASGKQELAAVAALLRKFDVATTGAKKDAVLDEVIAKLAGLPEGSPFAAQLAPAVRTALTSDPDNKQGRKMKAVKTLLGAGQIDDALTAAAKALDPKNANGLLEQVVLAQVTSVGSKEQIGPAVTAVDELVALGAIQDQEIAKKLYAQAAFFCSQHLKDGEKAKKYALKLQAVAGDDLEYKDLVASILDGKT